MMYIIYYTLGIILDTIMIKVLMAHFSADALAASVIVSLLIFVVWGSILISLIKDEVRNQRKDYFSIDEYKADRASYKAQLDEYKTEMRAELVEKYREFEEALMTKVQDSKLLATVLKDVGYHQMLSTYDNTVRGLLNHMHKCDRSISSAVRSMLARQDDSMWGFKIFIPNNLIIDENFNKEVKDV